MLGPGVVQGSGSFWLRQGCHRWAQARRGAEHPMEADVMDPWGWNERGQFLEQGQWRQDKMRRTIRRRAPHPVRKPPIRPLLEALEADGPPRRIETQPFEPLPVIGVDAHVGMERKAVLSRAAPLRRRCPTGLARW